MAGVEAYTYYEHKTEPEILQHFDLSIKIMDPKKTFENMIGDVIDTYRNTTLAVNSDLVRESLFETSKSHRVFYSKS